MTTTGNARRVIILESADAGATWTPHTYSSSTLDPDMQYSEGNAEKIILMGSSDGGTTWLPITNPGGGGGSAVAVQSADPGATGVGSMWQTTRTDGLVEYGPRVRNAANSEWLPTTTSPLMLIGEDVGPANGNPFYFQLLFRADGVNAVTGGTVTVRLTAPTKGTYDFTFDGSTYATAVAAQAVVDAVVGAGELRVDAAPADFSLSLQPEISGTWRGVAATLTIITNSLTPSPSYFALNATSNGADKIVAPIGSLLVRTVGGTNEEFLINEPGGWSVISPIYRENGTGVSGGAIDPTNGQGTVVSFGTNGTFSVNSLGTPSTYTSLTFEDTGTGTYLDVSDSAGLAGYNQISGTVDPSAGAGVPARLSSLYSRNNAGTTGELWCKTGTLDTAWTRVV